MELDMDWLNDLVLQEGKLEFKNPNDPGFQVGEAIKEYDPRNKYSSKGLDADMSWPDMKFDLASTKIDPVSGIIEGAGETIPMGFDKKILDSSISDLTDVEDLNLSGDSTWASLGGDVTKEAFPYSSAGKEIHLAEMPKEELTPFVDAGRSIAGEPDNDPVIDLDMEQEKVGVSSVLAAEAKDLGVDPSKEYKNPQDEYDILMGDKKEPSWYSGLSPYEKFKLFSLGGEALGDIVSYGPKMTAAIGDIQARGALGMAPGSAIDPIKEVGPSSFAPDVAEMFAERERKKERQNLMSELTKLVKGSASPKAAKPAGNDDVPEYGGVDDIISSMGPLQGLNSSSYEVKHKPSKLMLPKKKKKGDSAGYDRDPSLPSDAVILGVDAPEALPLGQAMGGEDDIWDHGVAVDIANRALEEGGNGDYVRRDRENTFDPLTGEPYDWRQEQLLSGLPPANHNEKTWVDNQRLGPVSNQPQQQELDLGPSRAEILNTPQVKRMRDASKNIINSEQIDERPEIVRPDVIDVDVDSNDRDRERVMDLIKRSQATRAEVEKDLEGQAPGQDSSPSDALTKIAAAMSISDKLDFLDDRKENKKVKEMEKQMQALKQQKREDADVEWMKLQQQKLKDSQIAPTQITPIRWS